MNLNAKPEDLAALPTRILSVCTSAGLLDKAFLAAGFDVLPGCEVMPHKRAIYDEWCGGEPLYTDIADLAKACEDIDSDLDCRFSGIIGGPPCQSHTKLRAMRAPKFPDLTPFVRRILTACQWDWYLFENVAPLDIPGAVHTRLNAMNFGIPHQSRSRWFTHSQNLTPPKPIYPGNADDLKAYSVVAGRIYGPKRGAWLQGWQEFAALPFPCVQLQEALADGVPRCLADAWIRAIKESTSCNS